MIWIIFGVLLLLVVYSVLVISGENVYRVTYHDPSGKEWEIMVSASTEREALKTARKAVHAEDKIVKIREEL